jgi:hypothetical protein
MSPRCLLADHADGRHYWPTRALKVPTAVLELIFSRSVSSLATHRAHTFWNFKRLYIMLYAKRWEHLVQLLHCLSLSSCQFERLFHPLHSWFCRSPNRSTRSGIICEFRTSLREYLHPVMKLFTQQTLPTINRKHVFMNILCIESFCPQNALQNAALR